MNLKLAVQEVIRQNKSKKYHPLYFISMTKNGEAESLEQIIKDLVLGEDAEEKVLKAIEKHGDVLLIEDLISEYGFDLSDDVIEIARARSEKMKSSKEFYEKLLQSKKE